MEERNIHNIRKHFEDVDVQRRIQDDILRAREDVTVTIGRAAQLFDFSESQLRDWEKRGLLRTKRSKGSEGQRLYALSELDKLAILKELVGRNNYSLGNIPPEVDKIWHSVYSSEVHNHIADTDEVIAEQDAREHRSIDIRVGAANKEEHWRYYISQTLRLALNLVCEDIPDTIAGIVLPLRRVENATTEMNSQALATLGPCLIGWRDLNNSFHTFYDEAPHFDFPTDFRVRGLRASIVEDEPIDPTFVVLQRNTKDLTLPLEVVEAVRHLLGPIYAYKNTWLLYFSYGMRNSIYPTTALGSINVPDSVLAFLADRIIDLGGQNTDGTNRWKFCCVLLPRSTDLPLQMRTLIVQAQSKESPHVVDKTFVSPDMAILGLSLRAFQSIHMLFRSPISVEDTAILYRERESPINSVIAMPIGGEDDAPIGVLYVTSGEPNAFDEPYQRVLRFMGRIVEDVLKSTHIRKQSEHLLRDIAARPRVINNMLESYHSENTFISDIEELLHSIEEAHDSDIKGNTSFISVDIDDLSNITNKFGDQISINLSKVFGDRIKNQAGMLDKTKYQMYHAYADRFYLMLNDTSLDRAREAAETLRLGLGGGYLVSVLPTSVEQPRSRVELKVTVRLGVSSYKHKKLYEVLQRYSPKTRVADVRSTILYFLDTALNAGKQQGGNCIISWYYPELPLYEHGRFALWPPSIKN